MEIQCLRSKPSTWMKRSTQNIYVCTNSRPCKIINHSVFDFSYITESIVSVSFWWITSQQTVYSLLLIPSEWSCRKKESNVGCRFIWNVWLKYQTWSGGVPYLHPIVFKNSKSTVVPSFDSNEALPKRVPSATRPTNAVKEYPDGDL